MAMTWRLTGETAKINLGAVGGYSSMVESKLVELVVAGSNPVGHPTFQFLRWRTVVRRDTSREQS